MVSVRGVLTGLAFAFTAYLGARGLLWVVIPDYPVLVVVALAVYLAGTWVCLLVQAERPREGDSALGGPGRLPLAAAVVSLVVAGIVPSVIMIAVGPAHRTESSATWCIGGIGALMTVVMVRRRPIVAWTGTALLSIACAAWIGVPLALALGLVGSIVWVAVAQLFVLSFDRAAQDAARLAELQQVSSAWQAAQVGRQRERRVQVQRALAVAGPVLTAVVRTGGDLDADERAAARLAEGRLRDELRAPRLLDDGVRDALDAARRRGATVTVLDEGGLDQVDPETLRVIRGELADTIRGATSQRLYIRTSPHDRVAVTVVGRAEATGALSDDDSVDLWREIAFPDA